MRKVVFGLAPLVLMLFLTEAYFRAFPTRDAYETNAGIVEPDPYLIWRLRPIADGPLATNELGLRDAAYNANADFKILVLGDSVAWGNGIADVNDVFALRLEQRLNAGGRGIFYDVINAAVPGYSTFQEAGWLERHGLALEPDLIVVQFCLNDVVERYRSLAEYGGNRHFLGVDTRATIRGIYGTALRASRAFEATARSVQALLRGNESYLARNLARDTLSPELERAWRRVEAELQQILDLAADRDVPVMLLIAPFRFQSADPGRFDQPQRRLSAWARSHSVEAVDVLAYFGRQAPETVAALFNDESHFSVAGHRFVAEILLLPVKRTIATRYPDRYQGGAGD
jgi:lysophospholipase L1-like esterase